MPLELALLDDVQLVALIGSAGAFDSWVKGLQVMSDLFLRVVSAQPDTITWQSFVADLRSTVDLMMREQPDPLAGEC